MYKFNEKQTGSIHLAVNTLVLQEYVEEYDVGHDYAELYLDDFVVRITSPMKNALQFTLHQYGETKVLESIVTDSIENALPIRRAVLCLFGTIMLQAFHADWDGYTVREGN